MSRVLIFGLPGSGKTYLAGRLRKYLGPNAAWFNADVVREEAGDWDFSDEGRARQSARMLRLCKEAEAKGLLAIADFVAPFDRDRKKFGADFEIFVDTIDEGRFEDTNKVFERPEDGAHYRVTERDGDRVAKEIANKLGRKFIWDNQAPTTQMLGRFQPWHDGHQALFDRAMAKHNQVYLMVRDMPQDDKNPYTAEQVVSNLSNSLIEYAGRVKIAIVPNVMNITYGRDVGYKIEQEVFDDAIHSISATKIREELKKEGKL